MSDRSLEAGLEGYRRELARWGSHMNLVGSTAPEAIERHIEDALAASGSLPTGARAVDLGSGAGLPGVPLAISRPDVRWVLVEVREARVHFLRNVARVLGLPIEVRRCRIEEAPEESFDVAVARALAPLERTLALSRPWIHDRGETWVWTRERPSDQALPGWSSIPIDPSGSRGHILRVPALAIPRGTSGA